MPLLLLQVVLASLILRKLGKLVFLIACDFLWRNCKKDVWPS